MTTTDEILLLYKQKQESSPHKRFYTPEENIQEVFRLYFLARELKKAGLKLFNPTWTDEELENKVTEIFRNAKT